MANIKTSRLTNEHTLLVDGIMEGSQEGRRSREGEWELGKEGWMEVAGREGAEKEGGRDGERGRGLRGGKARKWTGGRTDGPIDRRKEGQKNGRGKYRKLRRDG